MISRNETALRYRDGYMRIDPDTSNQLILLGIMKLPGLPRNRRRANNTMGLDINYKWERTTRSASSSAVNITRSP
jgi:hypothetical protein